MQMFYLWMLVLLLIDAPSLKIDGGKWSPPPSIGVEKIWGPKVDELKQIKREWSFNLYDRGEVIRLTRGNINDWITVEEVDRRSLSGFSIINFL